MAKGVRALLRKADDPSSISRKALRTQLEDKLGVRRAGSTRPIGRHLGPWDAELT